MWFLLAILNELLVSETAVEKMSVLLVVGGSRIEGNFVFDTYIRISMFIRSHIWYVISWIWPEYNYTLPVVKDGTIICDWLWSGF